ncbi:MAG: hypothetical protein J6X86_01910 [Bacteroidales bacterium]|nr:hypothetical protein [Bacteroidales bacterium]
MKEKTRKLILLCSLGVGLLITIIAILFAASPDWLYGISCSEEDQQEIQKKSEVIKNIDNDDYAQQLFDKIAEQQDKDAAKEYINNIKELREKKDKIEALDKATVADYLNEKNKDNSSWSKLSEEKVTLEYQIEYANDMHESKRNVSFTIFFFAIVVIACACLILWLVFGVIKVVKNPKKPLIATGIIVVVLLVAFLVAKMDKPLDPEFLQKNESTDGVANLIAIATYVTYFTVFGALAMLIYSEINKALKK